MEGRWAVPTIAGDTFAEKPPLQLWIIVASAKLRQTDVDPFDARVPSAIGGGLLALAAFWLGKRAGGPWHGALAALLVATTTEGFLRARWCQVDALFAGLFALAAAAALALLDRPRPRAVLALGALLGLATLTKGPLAPAMLAAALALDGASEARLGTGWLARAWKPISLGFLLAGAIAVPWYVELAASDAAGFGRAFFHENVKRFLSSQDHNNPPWYYLGTLWVALAPAAWLLPPALAFAWRTAYGRERGSIYTREDRALRFCGAIFAGGFLLLSAASSKQGKYLLPLAPATCVLVADFARHVVASGRPWERIWTTALLSAASLALVIAALLCLAASWFGPRADDALASLAASLGGPAEAAIPVSAALPPLLIVGFGSLALLAAGSGSRGSLRLGWLSVSFALAGLVGAGPVFRELDDEKSPRPAVAFAMERLAAFEREGLSPRYAVFFVDRASSREVVSWTGTSPFVYYATGPYRKPLVLRGAAALRAALDGPGGPLVLVMRQGHYAVLPEDLRARLRPRFQRDSGSRTLVVVDSGA